MTIKEIREATGLSQSQFATLIEIPVKTIQKWECGGSKPAEYVVTLIYKVLCYEGVLKGENMNLYVNEMIRPDETNLTEINIKDWKEKYPNKAAIVKLNEDGITAKLIIQSGKKARDILESKKSLMYGDNKSYIVI